MVNFMCLLVWATGCQDMWPSIILEVSVRVFLYKVYIQISGLLSNASLPSTMWVSHIQLVEGLHGTRKLLFLSKEGFSLADGPQPRTASTLGLKPISPTCRFWIFQPPQLQKLIPCKKSLSKYTDIRWFCFSGKTLTKPEGQGIKGANVCPRFI